MEDITYVSEMSTLSDKTVKRMLDEMGEYPVEHRFAALLLHAIEARENLSEEDLETLADYIDEMLDALNAEQEISGLTILGNCLENLNDQDLIDDTIHLFGKFFPKSLLELIVDDIEAIIQDYELSDEGEAFIDSLYEAWDIDSDFDTEEEDELDEEDEEEF